MVESNEELLRTLIKETHERNSVTQNLNNPWFIAVCLVSVLGYVYFTQQESQNDGIRNNNAAIKAMQSSQTELTQAVTKLSGIVENVVTRENRNQERVDRMTSDRFTSQEASSLKADIDTKINDMNQRILNDKAETKESFRNLEAQLDRVVQDLATLRGAKLGLDK
jgi:peptidoglycan hydrolase CwlO-like protein